MSLVQTVSMILTVRAHLAEYKLTNEFILVTQLVKVNQPEITVICFSSRSQLCNKMPRFMLLKKKINMEMQELLLSIAPIRIPYCIARHLSGEH